MTPTEIQALIAQGYRRTSNRHGLVSRIDRPDWREEICKHTHQTVEGIRAAKAGMWEDYYRRVLSNDDLTLGADARHVPTSSWDSVGFVKRS